MAARTIPPQTTFRRTTWPAIVITMSSLWQTTLHQRRHKVALDCLRVHAKQCIEEGWTGKSYIL
jgi:hypothetical protein